MFLYFLPDRELFWPSIAFSVEGKVIPSWVLKSKAAAPRLLFSISVPVPMACPADSSRRCFIRGWSSPPQSHVNSLRFNMLPLTFPSLWSCVTTGSCNHSCLSLDSQSSVSSAPFPLGQSGKASGWRESCALNEQLPGRGVEGGPGKAQQRSSGNSAPLSQQARAGLEGSDSGSRGGQVDRTPKKSVQTWNLA